MALLRYGDRRTGRLALRDPFEVSYNVGHVLSSHTHLLIKREMARAYATLLGLAVDEERDGREEEKEGTGRKERKEGSGGEREREEGNGEGEEEDEDLKGLPILSALCRLVKRDT